MFGAIKRGADSYREVLGVSQARRLAVGGLIGRFREGGTSLSILLAVRHAHSSFAVAGVASAAYLVGAAVSRPAQGRWIDRTGPRRALIIPSTANALALGGLAVAAWRHASPELLVGLAGLVGVTLPALSAALRTLWPTVVPDHSEHAYALDTLIYELALILSPALVGLLATLGSPPLALVTVAALGTIGATIVATSPAARDAQNRHPTTAQRRALNPALVSLIAISLLIGFAEGSLTVLAPGIAAAHHAPAASGLLLSALSAGSLLGALGYSAVVDRAALPRRLTGCTLALTAGFVLLGLFGHSIATFAVLAAVIGLALSPTLTTVFIAIRQTAPASALTEAFAWASFCASSGAAAGQALAGSLIAGAGLPTALWQPSLAAALAIPAGILAVRAAPRTSPQPDPPGPQIGS